MKAIQFLGYEKTAIVEVPRPIPQKGQVLVKILASALCGSERARYVGERQEELNGGHEAVGEIGDPNGSEFFQKGDRVCVQIMNGCGKCEYCKRKMPMFCRNLKYEGNCHAQYVALPEQCVIPIDTDIPPEIAVLLGGDLLGVARRAARQLPIREGQWIYVSGGGPIGLGVMLMLKWLGAKVILSEPHDFRRAFAEEHIGIDIALNPNEENMYGRLLEVTEGIGPEITIECSGYPAAQTQALDWTRCQGHVMFCGENYRGLNIVPSDQIIHKELNVHGAFYFTAVDVAENVSMYRKGMDPSAMISHKVSYEKASAAIDAFFGGKTGKVIFLPQE